MRESIAFKRVSSAIPLAVGYLLLCCLYAWQAARRDTPTIFSDELQFAQISRSIAETGKPARLGVETGFESLYTYLQHRFGGSTTRRMRTEQPRRSACS